MKIETHGLHNISFITLQKGKYLVIDPCYLIQHNNDTDWQNVCNSFNHPLFNNLSITFTLNDQSTHNGLIFSTAHGDGIYPVYDNETKIGHAGVDAGLLAFIPEIVAKEFDKITNDPQSKLGVWVNLNSNSNPNPYLIDDKKGNVNLHNIQIYTNDTNDTNE